MWTCRRCAFVCGTERHRSYHENRCTGIQTAAPLVISNGPAAAANSNDDGDQDSDADNGSNPDMFPESSVDSSSSSSSTRSNSDEENDAVRQHQQQLVGEAAAVYSAYGQDKCTFDLAEYIVRRSLGNRAGTELMQLADHHGINFGNGLHEKCNSYSKLNAILDAQPSLPFTEHKVSSALFPDREHALYTRDIISCIQHLWHEKQFDGHIHVKPCRERNEDGQRVVTEFFTGQFVADIYKELDEGDILIMLILYSDKTHQDVLGVHEAYPVYLYLGNIDTAIRTKNNNAGIVIGVLIMAMLLCLIVACS
jgi:hypothetical protein